MAPADQDGAKQPRRQRATDVPPQEEQVDDEEAPAPPHVSHELMEEEAREAVEEAEEVIADAAGPTLDEPQAIQDEAEKIRTGAESDEEKRQRKAVERTPEEIRDFLEKARRALLAEGFFSTPMQYRKKGQVFGVVKEHGHDLQIHVRAFDNGVIESEVELSNRYIQHLWSPRRSAHAEITRIFEKHDLHTDTINTEFRTRTGADRDQMPRFMTRTSDVVKGAVGVAGAVGAVAIARFIQRRSATERRGAFRGRRK